MAEDDGNSNSPTSSHGGGTPIPIDPNQNPSSPYNLHPRENPGAILVARPLNDTNYYNWSKAMRRALSSKKKLHFVTGGLPLPLETDPEYEAWETCNNTVVTWINRSLAPHIAQSTVSIDSAHELWLDLRDRFTKSNYFRMSNLLQDLHSMKQGDRTLTAYVIDMKILWDKLENLRPTPSCSCFVPCTCALSTAIKTSKETKYVICFHKGLNETYSNVRSTILTMDPLPSINNSYAMTSQQEITPTNPVSDSTVFSMTQSSSQGRGQPSQGRGRGRTGPKQQMLCTHCKKTNHTVENCYFKFGFPSGYRTKEQASASAMNISNDHTPPTQKSAIHYVPTSIDNNVQLSREDYHNLMTLLHSSKKDSSTPSQAHHNNDSPHHVVSTLSQTGNILCSKFLWILDSGSSDHVCPHISHFSSIKNIKPLFVKFPDGSTILAIYSAITDKLFLTDVLYIP